MARVIPPACAGGLGCGGDECSGYDARMADDRPLGETWSRDPRARQLVLVGVVLVASGLAHAVAWAILGGPWEGPVTWRKPILFGISGGLTSLSAAWVWA